MDNSPASNLPVELWIKIALTLRDGFPCVHGYSSVHGDPCRAEDCPITNFKTVRPLSESCRLLRAIVQPILYEYVKANARDDSHKVTSLASSLSKRPDLRSSVRTLELIGVEEGDYCDALLGILPLLVEVRVLLLTYGVIEEAIVKLLNNALRLHTLKIEWANWGKVQENWAEDGSFGRNLMKLHVHVVGADLPHNTPRNLQLFVPTITQLEINLVLILELLESPASLSFGHSLLRLDTGSYNSSYHKPLNQFVSRSPNLEELNVRGLRNVLPFNKENFPQLRAIDTDISLVTVLLPGRPIRSITTNANSELFANHLPHLEMLSIYGLMGWGQSMDVIDALLIACPGLVKLELQAKGKNSIIMFEKWIERRLVSDLAALPRLQILYLKNEYGNNDEVKPIQYPLSEHMLLERERITQARQRNCPDLYDVWLNSEYAWVFNGDNDAWAPKRRIVQHIHY